MGGTPGLGAGVRRGLRTRPRVLQGRSEQLFPDGDGVRDRSDALFDASFANGSLPAETKMRTHVGRRSLGGSGDERSRGTRTSPSSSLPLRTEEREERVGRSNFNVATLKLVVSRN